MIKKIRELQALAFERSRIVVDGESVVYNTDRVFNLFAELIIRDVAQFANDNLANEFLDKPGSITEERYGLDDHTGEMVEEG